MACDIAVQARVDALEAEQEASREAARLQVEQLQQQLHSTQQVHQFSLGMMLESTVLDIICVT